LVTGLLHLKEGKMAIHSLDESSFDLWPRPVLASQHQRVTEQGSQLSRIFERGLNLQKGKGVGSWTPQMPTWRHALQL